MRRSLALDVAPLLAAALALAPAARARADVPAVPKTVVVWPTLTPAGDDASPTPLHRPTSIEEPLATRAHELDATLRDATQDLGFVLDLADPGPRPGHARDVDMIARAHRAAPGETAPAGTWVVSARLEPAGGESFMLRLVAVPPNGKELRTRVETVKAPDISVRGLVMLRDLLAPDAAARALGEELDRTRAPAPPLVTMATPSRSAGRAILATNGALFGGYIGYSLVLSTGTNDPRVLYPLLTLGAAVGVGGALLTAEEWDVGTGDAWFLSAGAWWGAASGILLSTGTNAQPSAGPYAIGLGGGLGGVALAAFAISRSDMDEGDAVLAHSGAGVGLWLGSLIDLEYRGTTNVKPYTGAGFGTAIGLVSAGAASIFVTVGPSRVLLLDLGAGLGSLAGAAVTSPFIWSSLSGSSSVTPTDTRIFLAGTLAGTLAGGTAAWFLTRESPPPPRKVSWLSGTPSAGIIGESATANGPVPAYGVSYAGSF